QHELEVKGRLDQTLLEKVKKVVEVADVVGLELRFGAALAEVGGHAVHVREGVLEDVVARRLEVGRFPVRHSLPVLDLEDAEVERAKVEGRHLGPAHAEYARPLVD